MSPLAPDRATFTRMFAGVQTARVAQANVRHMASKLNTGAVASIALQATDSFGPHLQLRMRDYHACGGSIKYGRNGTTFAFTIGPVSDATVAALDDVAKARGRICVHAWGAPLLFELMGLERQADRKVRLVGTIVPANSDGAVANAF